MSSFSVLSPYFARQIIQINVVEVARSCMKRVDCKEKLRKILTFTTEMQNYSIARRKRKTEENKRGIIASRGKKQRDRCALACLSVSRDFWKRPRA